MQTMKTLQCMAVVILQLCKTQDKRNIKLIKMSLFYTPETSIVHLPGCLHREWVWRLGLGLLHS